MKKLLLLPLITSLLSADAFAGISSDITRPGNAISVHNRPQSDTVPLVVINGKVMGPITEVKILDSLSGDDIETMNVWKDTAAIRRYGPAARGGVIEITLKPSGLKKLGQPADNEEVIEKPEIEARFPGGDYGWRRYLERNLDGNIPVKNKAPEGTYTVIVKFKVDKEGNLSDIKPLTNHGYGMEEEVVRLLSQGLKWSPAYHNGKVVAAIRKQPVTFVVIADDSQEKDKKKKKNN